MVCDCLFESKLIFIADHKLWQGNGYSEYKCPLCGSIWNYSYEIDEGAGSTYNLYIVEKTKLHDELSVYGELMMNYIENRIDEILEEIRL